MKRIDLDTKEVMKLLSNKEQIIGQGTYGIVIPYDNDSLIKIYYKEIFDAFYYLDEQKLVEELETCKVVEQQMLQMFSDYTESLERNEKKLEVLENIGLLKAIVFCNDYLIGVILNYYKEYLCVSDIFDELSLSDKRKVLNNIREGLNNLMLNNIYPWDIKENNVLVRKRDLDIKLIDLDDDKTRFETIDYVEECPSVKNECFKRYDSMCKRLI